MMRNALLVKLADSSQFFAQVIVGCTAQCIGPVKQMKENSKFYSAQKSPRIMGGTLPHVTIQCPVYKESLTETIMPTVTSIKQAMSTYELQGGSANMFINDDGLQLIPEEDRNARIDFYADNSIGWTARPKHDPSAGFLRRGKFKKVRSDYSLRSRDNVRRDPVPLSQCMCRCGVMLSASRKRDDYIGGAPIPSRRGNSKRLEIGN